MKTTEVAALLKDSVGNIKKYKGIYTYFKSYYYR
jgi:hypothetical protein